MINLRYRSLILYLVSIFVAILLISATLNFSTSPGDNANCTSCHSENKVINKDNLIRSDIPVSGYVAGKNYIITVTANHSDSDRIGFEICAENNSSDKIGTFALINDELTVLTNNNNAVTHTAKGTIANNNSISWQFNWKAPVSGSGDVTFYLAINATNSDLSSSGDQVYLSSYQAIEEGTTGKKEILHITNQIVVHPNPIKNNLNISIAEGLNVNNLTLINLFGKVVKSIVWTKNNNKLSLKGLPSGIYFLVFKTDDKIITKKIHKQ